MISAVASVKTNLADYPVTMAMKDGRVTSSLVTLEYNGPKIAHDGFKAMLREHAFDAGELAVITYLQARAWGKPFVLLPIPISGRFQHHWTNSSWRSKVPTTTSSRVSLSMAKRRSARSITWTAG